MIHNVAIKSIVLPWTARTDVRSRRNWTYDLNAPPYTGPVPQVISNDAETDDEYEHRDISPDHTTPSSAPTAPHFADPFACTSGHASQSDPQAGETSQEWHYATMYRNQ